MHHLGIDKQMSSLVLVLASVPFLFTRPCSLSSAILTIWFEDCENKRSLGDFDANKRISTLLMVSAFAIPRELKHLSLVKNDQHHFRQVSTSFCLKGSSISKCRNRHLDLALPIWLIHGG